jgi:hypothetical protein
MVKLIYDFKQGRDTVSNTEHAATSTSIYHSADTTTTVHSLHWVFFQPVQSITAKTGSVRIYWEAYEVLRGNSLKGSYYTW